MASPRILLFGDSHSYAMQRAIERRNKKGLVSHVKVHRLLKEKNGTTIGDTTLEDFIGIARGLKEEDAVYSMIGGNQHAVVSTIQHPRAFDFFEPSSGDFGFADGAELIPYNAMAGFFEDGVRRGDGRSIEALRKAVHARVVHIVPPPPKRDNAHIQAHHESRFAQDGIAELGVSPPELRMKCWRMQTELLIKLCNEIDVEIMLPPSEACDADGFLLPEYYASDATHANPLYGELLLQAIEQRWIGGVSAGVSVHE